MTDRPWKLAEANYGNVKGRDFEVAVLPLGATEPHNLHLPYGIDTLEGTTVGENICRAAHERGAKVLLLPTMPYGVQTNMLGVPFGMNVNPATLNRVVSDLVDSLVNNGIHKIVILNSHGGNGMKPLLRELAGRQVDAFVCLCNWYTVFMDVYHDVFDVMDDHAGEMETSFAMAYFPELIGRNPDGSLTADAAKTAKTRFEALERGWVSITRPWHLLTTNCGTADPHAASAEKGEKMMQVIVDRLATYLVELSEAEMDDRFPFLPHE